jgi:hypothetical protein
MLVGRGAFYVPNKEVTSTFAARIAKLMERVEYRRADSCEDKDAIFRMRHEAYTRERSIEPNSTGLFCDPEDEMPNAWLIGVFIDGVLASSIRLHVASRPEHYLPVTQNFPDIILPRLQAGDVLIDATRQTSRIEFTRTYPFLTYITMRLVFVAEEHFGGDFITAACRPENQAAFRRLCGFVNWAPPRPYPPLARPQALMGYDCKAKGRATRERYPFVPSSVTLRKALFEKSSTLARDLYDDLTLGHRERRFDKIQHSTTCAA